MAKVKTIFRKCLLKAKTEKYCIGCKFSYIQPETGYGYCKYQDDKAPLSIKAIEEFDTCDSWEKK